AEAQAEFLGWSFPRKRESRGRRFGACESGSPLSRGRAEIGFLGANGYACALRFCRLLTRSSTTAGSASVEVSPRLPYSSSTILRRMRRMILPERVFGRPGAK